MISNTVESIPAPASLTGPAGRLIGMLKNSPVPAFISDADGHRILSFNQAFTTVSGYEPSAASVLTVSQLFSCADLLTRLTSATTAAESVLLRTCGGVHVTVTVSAYPLQMDGASLLVVTLQDQIEHIMPRDSLKQSEERLRLALGGAVDGLWDWDLINGETYLSPDTFTKLGYQQDVLNTSARSLLRLIHPKDARRVLYHRRKFLRGQTDRFEIEFRARHKQGRYLHVLSRGFGVADDDGRIVRIVGTHQDISKRKRTEKLLKLNERRLRTLYDDSPTMFFTLGKSGRISSVNRFGAEHLGSTVDAMMGRSIFEFIHADDRESFRHDLTKFPDSKSNVYRVEFRLIHQFGESLWVRAAIRSTIYDKQKSFLVTCEDISEARILSEQLEYQAMHDSLTGLINRSEFERRLRSILMFTSENAEHALCYLDLDQFKVINDTCGHLAGDELLRRLSDLLNTVVRKRDTLARLGGDEFAVLLEHCPFYKAREIAENLLDTIKTFRFEWQDKHFTLGASIGLVPIGRDSGTLSDILSTADSACYAAKDAGRNRVHIYNPEDTELSERRSEMHWVAEITFALERDRFLLAVQPIINLQAPPGSKEGKHFEVLIRMQDKNGELIMPGSFLPAAEKYNLSSKVDQWVVDKVFDWLLNDPEEREALHMCSINLSGQSVSNPHFMNYLVDKLMLETTLANKICFEVTETAAIVNLGHAIKFMNTMKDLGCSFSLDDFGTGLSSFSYLKNLPVDFLKIDGAFIRNIVQDPIDQSMVHSINQIGQVMGKATIAEFVENDAIRKLLTKIGVNYAQGYGIGRPVLLRDIKK